MSGGPGPGTPVRLTTASAAATRDVAAAVARHCRPGDVLLLVGDLGAGKTTFAQGLGAGLGITEPVTSPTFTLVRQYPLTPGDHGLRTFFHADVYRLDLLQEIADLGIGELVEDGGVALVEWGDAAAPVLGTGALEVCLRAPGDSDDADADDDGDDDGDDAAAVDGDDERELLVRGDGERWRNRWGALVADLVPWRSDR